MSQRPMYLFIVGLLLAVMGFTLTSGGGSRTAEEADSRGLIGWILVGLGVALAIGALRAQRRMPR